MKLASFMLSLLLIYLSCLLLLFIFQRKLIYFPERLSLSEQVLYAEQSQLALWPDTAAYRGLISLPGLLQSAGTVIIFHGNAGSVNSRFYYVSALEKLGYRVILAEYPGYGARPGILTEDKLITDAIETVQLAYDEFGGPVFLWGESLGSGIVAGVVQRSKIPVQGLVLMTPFDSLANMAQHHYGFFLAKWLIRDQYDNIKNLKKYPGNIAILQANQDQVIPEKSTQRLFLSLVGNKKIWEFEQAGHNTIPVSAGRIWWHQVMKFLKQ